MIVSCLNCGFVFNGKPFDLCKVCKAAEQILKGGKEKPGGSTLNFYTKDGQKIIVMIPLDRKTASPTELFAIPFKDCSFFHEIDGEPMTIIESSLCCLGHECRKSFPISPIVFKEGTLGILIGCLQAP